MKGWEDTMMFRLPAHLTPITRCRSSDYHGTSPNARPRKSESNKVCRSTTAGTTGPMSSSKRSSWRCTKLSALLQWRIAPPYLRRPTFPLCPLWTRAGVTSSKSVIHSPSHPPGSPISAFSPSSRPWCWLYSGQKCWRRRSKISAWQQKGGYTQLFLMSFDQLRNLD